MSIQNLELASGTEIEKIFFQGNYFKSGIVQSEKIKGSASQVLQCIIEFWNSKQKKCWLKQKSFSSLTGLSRDTVNKAIDKLRQKNLILTTQESGEICNYYLTEKFFSYFKNLHGGKKSLQGCRKILQHENVKININNKSSLKKIKKYVQNDDDFKKLSCKGLLDSSKPCNNSTVQRETKERLIELGFTDADKIIRRHDIERIKSALSCAENNKVKSKGKYVRSLLKSDLFANVSKKVKNAENSELIEMDKWKDINYKPIEEISGVEACRQHQNRLKFKSRFEL